MVVVCEPITVRLNTSPPPEHWSWYLVITPFGVTGALQLKIIEVELAATPKNRRGGPAGTVQHIMSDITVVIVNDVLTIFIRGSTNCCWWTISHHCCCTHSTGIVGEWINIYNLACSKNSGLICHAIKSAVDEIADNDSITL